jgi:hypothetical protein
MRGLKDTGRRNLPFAGFAPKPALGRDRAPTVDLLSWAQAFAFAFAGSGCCRNHSMVRPRANPPAGGNPNDSASASSPSPDASSTASGEDASGCLAHDSRASALRIAGLVSNGR